MTTLPTPPRSSLVDPKTGTLTREWVRFFDDLRRAIISGLDEGIAPRLDQLEADNLFDTGNGAGSNTSYNDATVRGRLDAIETELMFPPVGGPATDQDEVNARLTLLEQSQGDAQIDALTTPNPAQAIRRLNRAVRDLETAQAFVTDASATIAALVNRLAELEMAQALVPDASATIAVLASRLAALETEGTFP
jgi:hypothetical protein